MPGLPVRETGSKSSDAGIWDLEFAGCRAPAGLAWEPGNGRFKSAQGFTAGTKHFAVPFQCV